MADEISLNLLAPEMEPLWLEALAEVLKEQGMTPTLLDELKEMWRANHERHKFNPLLKEVRELIRRHDPAWDEARSLSTTPKFNISIGGGPPRPA